MSNTSARVLASSAPQPPFCSFCRRNGEPEVVYTSHMLKDRGGKVTCPQLYKYRCEICGATGPEAHTRYYCPETQHHLLRNANAAANKNNNKGPNANRNKQPPTTTTTANSSSDSGTGTQHHRQHDHNDNRQQLPQCAISAGSNAAYQVKDDDCIYLGKSRLLCNMGSITRSRYNSAGQLRNKNSSSYQQRPSALCSPAHHKSAPRQGQAPGDGSDRHSVDESHNTFGSRSNCSTTNGCVPMQQASHNNDKYRRRQRRQDDGTCGDLNPYVIGRLIQTYTTEIIGDENNNNRIAEV